jgi:hypothetical protein
VAAFPPTYKNGYERLYRFVDENTEWDRPAYEVWDPSRIEDWLDELDATGVHYCVLTDHTLERHEPATVYRSNTNKPVYTFADRAASSVRRGSHKSEPFRYISAHPAALTAKSTVEIVATSSGQMNFLKGIYLAKAIAHTSGIANFLVLIDGHRGDIAADTPAVCGVAAQSQRESPGRTIRTSCARSTTNWISAGRNIPASPTTHSTSTTWTPQCCASSSRSMRS